MKSWDQFKQDKGITEAEATWFQNPVNDVDRYITGLGNRLRLLSKEEIGDRRTELQELVSLITYLLK
jgi:hypothetical protein